MGLDITVLALDWTELERTPRAERQDLLYEAACPEDLPWDAASEAGWTIPASPRVPWSGRYEFRDTLGSYKPHFWAAERWDCVREFAGPAARRALDGFLGHLIWAGEGDEDDPDTGLFPSDPQPWRPKLLLALPPATVPALAAHWARAEPLLGGLRETYDARAARPGGWIAGFDEFVALLRQWADVVAETSRRGWGLLALPV
ncbi:hypothetical protein AB0E25_36225 [Streptomyces bobili]|uniref:hypothetical protein n=1 Tax=Streptomyces bobili TaxID=67280 RepID=UPI0034112A41